MAVFTSSVMALRRKMIVRCLRKSGAVSPDTAKTLEEARVINPDNFPEFTQQLVWLDVIHRTKDGKYYTDPD